MLKIKDPLTTPKISMNSINLHFKENLSLRFSGEEIIVSFVASKIQSQLEKIAIEKDYISRLFGYKNTVAETFIQIYSSLSNPELRRKPRGRTTRRIVLEKEDIEKLANQFVQSGKNSKKIHIRIQGSGVLCIIIRELMQEVLKDFLCKNNAQIELKNIRNYPDRKFETMDLEIFSD